MIDLSLAMSLSISANTYSDYSESMDLYSNDLTMLPAAEGRANASTMSMLRQQSSTIRSLKMGLGGIMASMNGLVVLFPQLEGATEVMRKAMIVMIGAMGVYSLVKAAMLIRASWETALAVMETAAKALIPVYGEIAIAAAVGAAALVVAAFGGSWQLNLTGDYDTSMGRRDLERQMGAING